MTSESQIIVYGPNVNLTERKSALTNSIQEVVTVGQLRGYSTYTALLTQTGVQNGVVIDGGDAIVSGVTYEIVENPSNVDLTSIGAPNSNVNTHFVANQNVAPGTFPSNLNLAYDEGAPVVTILDRTINDNIYFLYSGVGYYVCIIEGVFPASKTFVNICSTSTGSARAHRESDDYLKIKSYSSGTTQANGILNKTPLEIRIYE